MASNVCEWITETSNYSSSEAIWSYRGGFFNGNNYVCGRYCGADSGNSFSSTGFRPLLYVNI